MENFCWYSTTEAANKQQEDEEIRFVAVVLVKHTRSQYLDSAYNHIVFLMLSACNPIDEISLK